MHCTYVYKSTWLEEHGHEIGVSPELLAKARSGDAPAINHVEKACANNFNKYHQEYWADRADEYFKEIPKLDTTETIKLTRKELTQ